MLGSIRWRLVASYVLITLLTASLIGLLTLSLIRHYVRQQETARLTANAETIAHQALPLMQPVVRQSDLMELAQTASFFVNARVRILDDQQRVLADSGSVGHEGQFLWIAPPARFRVEWDAPPSRLGPAIMMFPPDEPIMIPGQPVDQFGLLKGLPPDTQVRIVGRIEGPWGDRIILHSLPRRDLSAIPFTNTAESQEPQGLADPPRSRQVVLVPVSDSNRPVGHVELSRGPDFSAEALLTTGRALFFAACGAIVLAAIVGLLVSRGLTAPLQSLITAASQMSSGNLSARAPVRGKGEIGRLANQFNEMADRLESSFTELAAERDALRRFIADASHELRTPITALRTFNELLQGPAGDQPATRDEFLTETQAQLSRLEWIIHNLLDLSRLDARLAQLDLADHPLNELIESSVALFRGLAQEKDIVLSIPEPIPQITINCDRARLEAALCNLLDNAIKFTPPGGHVEIGAEQKDDIVRLWVCDSGPGVSNEDLPHIFDRFYRGQVSKTEGSGLGLAIVQSVVQAHGGQVLAESQPGEGSRFVIELPLCVRAVPPMSISQIASNSQDDNPHQ